MAWATIFRSTNRWGADHGWRLYLGDDSFVSEDPAMVEYVVNKLKPFMDLIGPTPTHSKGWVKWCFSKEEYNAMMGGSDGSE